MIRQEGHLGFEALGIGMRLARAEEGGAGPRPKDFVEAGGSAARPPGGRMAKLTHSKAAIEGPVSKDKSLVNGTVGPHRFIASQYVFIPRKSPSINLPDNGPSPRSHIDQRGR